MKLKSSTIKSCLIVGLLIAILGCKDESKSIDINPPQVIGICCDISSSLDSLSIVKIGEKCAKLIDEAAPGSTLRFTVAEQNTYIEPLLIFTKATTQELADPFEKMDAEERQELMQKEIQSKLLSKFLELKKLKGGKGRRTCLINAMIEAANWTQLSPQKANAFIYVFSDMREECENGPFGKIRISKEGLKEKTMIQIGKSDPLTDLSPIKEIHLNITNMDYNALIYTTKLKDFWIEVVKKLGAEEAPIWGN